MNLATNTKQFLTFKLGDEQYGLDVLKVREVLEVPLVTRVPRMPAYIRGVINIRGSVITVIDLRQKLDLEAAEQTVHSRVIIIEINLGNESLSIGILVDSVQEVLDINMGEVTATPHIGTAIDAAYIEGISRQESGFIMMLNIDLIFHESETSTTFLQNGKKQETNENGTNEDFSELLNLPTQDQKNSERFAGDQT